MPHLFFSFFQNAAFAAYILDIEDIWNKFHGTLF